jgi:hypothetical protein
LQVVLTLHVLNPLVTLGLRVNKKRPALSGGTNHTVLDGESISGKTLDVPLTDHDWVTQNALDAEVV